jgi:dolichol-phosphate mannosyltransferase
MAHLDVSVVIATYNERENIGELISVIEDIFKDHEFGGEIIIVDDNSPDRTADVVLNQIKRFKNIKLIKRPKKMGIGSAYFAGIKNAEGNVIVTMDADFSHPPNILPEMIKKAMQGCVVSGSRFVKGGEFSTKIHRLIGTLFLNFWVRILLKTKVKDNTNGYLAIKRCDLRKIITKCRKFGIEPFEIILFSIPILTIAEHIKLKICEIPVTYVFRKRGQTKINFFLGVKSILTSGIHILKIFKELR